MEIVINEESNVVYLNPPPSDKYVKPYIFTGRNVLWALSTLICFMYDKPVKRRYPLSILKNMRKAQIAEDSEAMRLQLMRSMREIVRKMVADNTFAIFVLPQTKDYYFEEKLELLQKRNDQKYERYILANLP